MKKFKEALKNPAVWIAFGIGAAIGVAYLVKSKLARKAVSKLPASATAGETA